MIRYNTNLLGEFFLASFDHQKACTNKRSFLKNEQAFSRMGCMVSARRTVIIVKSDEKWIIRYNHLPKKHRLLEVVEERKIKRTKLNKDLRIQMNEYSNEYLFTTNAF